MPTLQWCVKTLHVILILLSSYPLALPSAFAVGSTNMTVDHSMIILQTAAGVYKNPFTAAQYDSYGGHARAEAIQDDLNRTVIITGAYVLFMGPFSIFNVSYDLSRI